MMRIGPPQRSPNTHQSKKKPINIRRGEGGGAARGGPLWPPAVPQSRAPLHAASQKNLPVKTPPPPLQDKVFVYVSSADAYWHSCPPDRMPQGSPCWLVAMNYRSCINERCPFERAPSQASPVPAARLQQHCAFHRPRPVPHPCTFQQYASPSTRALRVQPS
jgi:hypothetical protein